MNVTNKTSWIIVTAKVLKHSGDLNIGNPYAGRKAYDKFTNELLEGGPKFLLNMETKLALMGRYAEPANGISDICESYLSMLN